MDYIAVLSSPTASAEGSSVTVASAPRSAQDILTSMLALPPLPAYLSLKVMAIPALDSIVAAPALNTVAATFVYDGDGNRVKSVVNGVTTYFVGNYYEKTDTGVVTKYYYAGGQRIAMQKGGVLTYLLSDHLGSTSITTNESGIKTSELRYSAWGEVRYSSGTTSTGYQYTGQFSYAADFGLLYYNARWVDPVLGRFAQPDIIIPQGQGVQAWDRYAFVNNNPTRYTDPSGHCISDPVSFMVCAMVAGAVIDAGINAYSQYQDTGHIDSGEVFNHAVEGALIGGGVVIAAVAAAALIPTAAVVGTAACRDGDCTNEAVAAGNAITNIAQAVNADGDPTNEVTAITKYYPPNMGAAEGEWLESPAYNGQILSRIGGDGGNFFAEPGTPWWQRALPNGQASGSERLFQVEKPFPMYVSRAASWFNQPGGGVQYRTAGKYLNLEWLLNNGYLTPAK